MDICSLFYNLILNAVEANLKIEDKRFIKLYIANIKNNVLIKIVNPVDENFNLDIDNDNQRLISIMALSSLSNQLTNIVQGIIDNYYIESE